jgi:Antitoxin VbhA
MSTSTVKYPAPVTQIDPAERARRTAAVQSATGHVRMEGLYASPRAVALEQRYIDGEITDAEILHELLANHSC